MQTYQDAWIGDTQDGAYTTNGIDGALADLRAPELEALLADSQVGLRGVQTRDHGPGAGEIRPLQRDVVEEERTAHGTERPRTGQG